jgi:hypothetical protein
VARPFRVDRFDARARALCNRRCAGGAEGCATPVGPARVCLRGSSIRIFGTVGACATSTCSRRDGRSPISRR